MAEKRDFCVLERTLKESAAEYAYRCIRYNIMSIAIPPEEVLNEEQLAALLGVSRTPVHEAMRKLQDERLVDIAPRAATVVSKINIALINEAVFVRNCIEPEVITLASKNVSQENLIAMQKNLDEQQCLLGSEDLPEIIRMDNEFHKLVYIAAGKTNTYEMVKKMCVHLDRVRYLFHSISNEKIERLSYEDHCQVFNMVTYGIALDMGIGSFIERHICRFRVMIPTMKQKFPNYFTF